MVSCDAQVHLEIQYSPDLASRLRIQRQYHPNDKEFTVEVISRRDVVSGNDIMDIVQTFLGPKNKKSVKIDIKYGWRFGLDLNKIHKAHIRP